MKNRFIDLIKASLDKSEISLRELARRSGLDVSYLSKILNGHRNPPSYEKDIIKIAEILQLNPDELIFAAGRIPSKHQNIFNDPDFVKSIMDGSYKQRKQATGPTKKQIRVHEHTADIEDELL